jgi:hypothetical protein
MIAPLEALPDPGGHGLEDFQTSPCGTVFFSSLRKRVVRWNLRAAPGLDLHPQAPETRAELTAAGTAHLNLRFTHGEGKVYHTWRVDGGPCSARLIPLKPGGPPAAGPHRVESGLFQSGWCRSVPVGAGCGGCPLRDTVEKWLRILRKGHCRP